jgi:hypothetical protein
MDWVSRDRGYFVIINKGNSNAEGPISGVSRNCILVGNSLLDSLGYFQDDPNYADLLRPDWHPSRCQSLSVPRG